MDPPLITLRFMSRGTLTTLELVWDLSGKPPMNDPLSVSQQVGKLYALGEDTVESLKASIDSQLHAYALRCLKQSGKGVDVYSGPSVSDHLEASRMRAKEADAKARRAAMERAKAAAPTTAALQDQARLEKAQKKEKRRREKAESQANSAKRRKGEGEGGEGGEGEEEDEEDEEGGRSSSSAQQDDGNLDYCFKCLEEDGAELLCCDRCPLSFHMTCVNVKEVPEGEYLCVECVAAFGKRGKGGGMEGAVCTVLYTGDFTGRHATCPTLQQEILDIIAKIREHDFAATFETPVDAKNIPGYATLIKRPMDYGTLAKDLQAGKYGSGAAIDAPRVITNLRLVVYNAMLYNRPGCVLWRMAEYLFRMTETALRDRVKLTPAQAQRLKELHKEEMSDTNPAFA